VRSAKAVDERHDQGGATTQQPLEHFSLVTRHVRPVLGDLPLCRIEVPDALYATVPGGRAHCDSRGHGIDHRTA
jgi:hypothetical protein